MPTLSEALRAGTSAAHRAAEDTDVARGLVAGEQPRSTYVALLGQLEHIYAAIEATGEALADDPVVGGFVDPRLHRLAAIRADLGALGETSTEPWDTTVDYVERIVATAGAPERWVAHHYTRYLGDLSGGRVLAKALERHLGLTAAQLSFFDFSAISAGGAYKVAYRDRLDELGEQIGAAGCVAVVDEASAAFEANRKLFDAVAAAGAPA